MELKGNAVGIFLTAFVVILIGINFTAYIGTSTAATSALNSNANQTFTWVNNTAFQLRDTQIVSGSEVVTNNSNTKLVSGTHYTMDYVNGRITVTNVSTTSTLSNPLNVSYTFRPGEYVNDGTSRTILSLNTLWFALFVLAAALVLVLRAYPELFNF